MGDRRRAYRILMGISEGKRTLGSRRHGWKDDDDDNNNNNSNNKVSRNVMGAWSGWIWLRIGTGIGLL